MIRVNPWVPPGPTYGFVPQLKVVAQHSSSVGLGPRETQTSPVHA